jgi:hypothetical protein
VDTRKLMAIAAVPAVLIFSALGFASQHGSAQHSSRAQATQQSAQAENIRADPDNIQQGDRTSPDKLGQAGKQEARGPDRDDIQQGGGNQVEDGKPDLPGAAAEDGD